MADPPALTPDPSPGSQGAKTEATNRYSRYERGEGSFMYATLCMKTVRTSTTSYTSATSVTLSNLVFPLHSTGFPSFHMADDFTTDDDSAGSAQGAGFSDDDQTLITREGLKKLKEELQTLKTVRRQEVAQRLKEAISYGDLSENSEYEEAKNEQAFVEGRILELEQKIKNAKIITEKKSDTKSKEVDIGSTVTVQNKTDNDEPERYTIVGSTEADPLDQKISNESPMGKALLGRHKGDEVEIMSPSGKIVYEILQVA